MPYIGILGAEATGPGGLGGPTLGEAGLTDPTIDLRSGFGGTLIAFTRAHNSGPSGGLTDTDGNSYSQIAAVSSAATAMRVYEASGHTTFNGVGTAHGFGSSDYADSWDLHDLSVPGSPTILTHSFPEGNVFAMPSLGGYAPVITISGGVNDCAAAALYWSDGTYLAGFGFGWHDGGAGPDPAYSSISVDSIEPNVFLPSLFTWLFAARNGGFIYLYNAPVAPGSPYIDARYRASQSDETF